MREFLFGDDAGSATSLDAAVVLLLMLFLLASTLSIAAMNIAYGFAMVLWIAGMVYKRKWNIPRTPFDYFLLAYVAAETLSTIFAYNKSQSLLIMYRRVTLLPIIYIVFAHMRSRRVLKLFLAAFILSVLAAAVWSLRDVALHLNEYITFSRRSNVLQMYMTAGGMMMFGLLLLLPFVVHPKTPPQLRWIAVVAMIPIGLNLLFTFTRSSWLGFLTGAVVIAAMRTKKMILPLAAIVLAVVLLASPEMQERMSSIFNPYHPNNVSRLHMWETGLRIFAGNPIVGVGDIGIEQVWKTYADPAWEAWGHLHNNLLMWLVTLGVVGFTVLVGLFVAAWRFAARTERRVREDWFAGSLVLGALAVMAGFHVNGLFEWNFGDSEIIMVMWAILGMTLSAGRLAAERLASNENEHG